MLLKKTNNFCDYVTNLLFLLLVTIKSKTIYNLLMIFSTSSVTYSSTERLFSMLKLIKMGLRTRMLQERFTGSALMYIHQDIIFRPKDIIER